MQGIQPGDEASPEVAGLVAAMLPAWEVGAAENAGRMHVVVRSLPLWRALRADAAAAGQAGRPCLLHALQRAGARLHLITDALPFADAAHELEGLHGVSIYLPHGMDARRDLMPAAGACLAAFLAAPSLRHAWVLFSRQMVWDVALTEILAEVGGLPSDSGVFLWHNCHHRRALMYCMHLLPYPCCVLIRALLMLIPERSAALD